MVKSRKISILLAVAMLVSIMIPTTAFAGPTKAPTKDGHLIRIFSLNSTEKLKILRTDISAQTREFLITQLKH